MFKLFSSKPSSESKPSAAGNTPTGGKPASDGKPSYDDFTGKSQVHSDPDENEDVKLVRGTVYIALFDTRSSKVYHWGLLVATNDRTGMLYHNTNEGAGYMFKAHYRPHILNSQSLLALVEISVLDLDHKGISQLFAQTIRSVPVGEHRCKTWMFEALWELSQTGLLGCNINEWTQMDALEVECVDHVRSVRKGESAMIGHSRYYGD
ncbi:hypothetical protein AJ79_05114 [Helicocarpus griseus UAMH5409]|uniref:Uncharacterized protein n=1 Tax=Helicocarpus griseus UAMH5409 TaxID=1447875 RepID=A0A2B7XR01_9EURO|nr:hypothetical protein AJ79_05114 [Helicocarpus griseus UAMH5409]